MRRHPPPQDIDQGLIRSISRLDLYSGRVRDVSAVLEAALCAGAEQLDQIVILSVPADPLVIV